MEVRKLPVLSLALLVLVLAAFAPLDVEWGAWQRYARMMQGEKPFLTVEYRTKHSANAYPRVQWRIENHSAQTLYCVSIGDRVYRLSDGSTQRMTAEGCRTIEPGETETYTSDNAGGGDGLRVTQVRMARLTASPERGGTSHPIALH